ncbi:MAG: ABC transporter ATP-binding protein [Anaerolineaceae bacterium]|nr:ABC transporter ATP-binding protein [Anaerolineaceae bacterium]
MLQIRDLTRSFGGLRAVDGVSFDVGDGQVVGLIGPNGSGKSTLINLIAGQLHPDSGSIHFDGQEITQASPDAINRLGLARGYQDPALFFQMSLLDNTLLPAREQLGESPWQAPRHGRWRYQEQQNAGRAATLLERLQLRGHFDRRASDLSGGQMKLLDIGRSLSGEPRMLLLDEPTAGVAPKLAREIFQHIATLNQEAALSFLIVEHRLDILFDYVDQVIVLHMGKVLAAGKPDDIMKDARVREVYFGL